MKQDRINIYNKYNGCCAYCGHKIDLSNFEIDHLIPILRNYKDRDVDNDENKMPSCRACNRGKKSYSLENWRLILEGKISELNRDSGAYRAAKRFGLVNESDKKVVFYFEKNR